MSAVDGRVIDLLAALVRIDSVNPTLVPGAAGEAAVAAYLADWLQQWPRLAVEVVEAAPGRPNVVAQLPGTATGPTLLLTTHLDTVGVEHMDAPFSGEIRDDRLYGRGAMDIKSGVAAMAGALATLAEGQPLAGTVILAAVADEEAESLGTEHLARTVRADAAIVLEPTDLRPCLAHRGFVWLEVETHGRAAHGSRPAEGIDAILMMGGFLAELAALDARLQRGPAYPLVGPASLHAGTIRGGLGPSIYPDACVAGVERRTIPGETPVTVAAEIDAIHDRLRATDPRYQAETRVLFSRPPYEVDAIDGARLLENLNAAIAARTGVIPTPMGHAAWMDSAILGAAGIPAIVFGPGGEGMHGAVEYVRLPEVLTCAAVLVDLAQRFCGVSP
ncbi:MAG: M20/M25/M40 family metallo-hydrolase [Chloroflexi bacterium]|nr:M20/M25/M40 family metallo-hydrolase [Chloroflexota bacterium]